MTDVARARQDLPAVHRRRVGGFGVGRDARRREPGRRHGHRPGPGVERRGRGSRRERRGDRVRDVAAHHPGRAQPDAAQARRRDRGARRRARSPRVEERRQAGRRRDRRDPGRRRQPALLRRWRAGHGRQGRQRVRGRPDLDDPARAGRRRRLDRAVELPDHDGRLEDRSGPRGGQHGHPQAVGANAADGPHPRRDRRRHPAARRAQRHHRDGRRRSATRSSATRRSG